MKSLNVVFAGTPEFSVAALRALLGSEHRVIAAYTQPDRPAGRGRELTMSAVKRCALEHGIAVEQPASLRDPASVARLAALAPDIMVVVAYGLILPAAILAIPRHGCVNIHASLLPRWRGAAPIHRAVLAGDRHTGVCIMRMDEGLDTGPVLLERRTEIGARETTASVHDRLATFGAEALLQALQEIAAGTAVSRAQPADGVTYAAKVLKEEAVIDWTQPAIQIDRRVRAFNPWPVAQTTLRGSQLRLWSGEPMDVPTAASPGTVFDADSHGIKVATGAGAFNLTHLQLAGRKHTSAAEFLNANTIVGTVLGSAL